MLDHILKISRPGDFDIRCLRWNTAIIVFMKDAAWIEDDIKVVIEFPCLLGHPGYLLFVFKQGVHLVKL